jgi:hypothetical protein
MTMGDVQVAIQLPPEIMQDWGWFLAFGIGLVVLGIAAVARSVTATVVSMVFSAGFWCWPRESKSPKP